MWVKDQKYERLLVLDEIRKVMEFGFHFLVYCVAGGRKRWPLWALNQKRACINMFFKR